MSRQKKKNKGIAGMALFLGWLIFILLALIFYFYFSDGFASFVKKWKNDKTAAGTLKVSEGMYEVNAYPEINALIAAYLEAEAACDREVLVMLVTRSDEFADMANYTEKAKLIAGYENIICYSLQIQGSEDKIVYAVANMKLSEESKIKCRPLNINCYYVKKTDDGYLIDNSGDDADIQACIDAAYKNSYIQELYKSVNDDIKACVQNDAEFARLYNKIQENGQ
ncbi:MAG: hypothetical protein NC393_11010 [Clostridium sp.]|nr:hypothetical protein [Clostridium sp.]MCM1172636.1 hypothetical protein [Clostridium sp.]MCM1208999.1 hypothetical protein [Ruminococcus sp.]